MLKSAHYKLLCGSGIVSVALLAGGLAHAQGVPSPAEAREAATTGDEIVVTARRREESLQEVPISVTAYSGERLSELGINSAADLAATTPSLVVSSSLSQAQSGAFTIRGQGQAFGGSLPGVITYFSEVPLDSNGAAAFVLDDMQSVQVLRGPQGTLFGRNTNGGAVLMTPRAPSGELEGDITVSAGNLDYRRISGGVSFPLHDTFSVRISGSMAEREGYTENLTIGGDFDDINSDAWRVFARWEPTSAIRSDFIYQGFQSDTNGTSFILHQTTGGGVGPVLAPGLVTQQANGIRTWASAEEGLGATTDVSVFMNTTTFDLGGIQLKNILSYQRVQACYGSDIDGVAAPMALSTCFANQYTNSTTATNAVTADPIVFPTLQPDTNLRQWTEEFQVSGSSFDDKLDWIVGAFFLQLETPGGLDTFQTYRIGMTAGLAVNVSSNQTEDSSTAIFAQGTYDLSNALEGLSVTAGARYTWDERNTSFGQYSSVDGGATYACRSDGLPTSTPIDECYRIYNGEYEDFGYTFSLDWQATDDLLLYFAHRRGFKSGGFNTVSVDSTPEYQPEIATDYEIGLKSEFDLGAVSGRFNADYFYVEFENLQRQVVLFNPTPAVSISDGVEGHMQGIEAEALIRFGDHFDISATYSWLDAEYDVFFDTGLDASSSPFPSVPENSGSVTARYFFPLSGSLGEVTASATYSFSDRTQFDNGTNAVLNPDAFAPAHELINARLQWDDVGGRPVSVALWGHNLADEEYVVGGIGLQGLLGFNSRVYGPPRTYGVELTYRFGE